MIVYRAITLIVLTLLIVGCASQKQHQHIGSEVSDGATGLIYGKEHSFMVSAPKGWILDNKSGVAQGLHAVFYPIGSNWQDSQTVMYVNTATIDPDTELAKFIEEDIERFKKEKSSNLKIQIGNRLKTSDGKIAEVRYFTGDKWNNYETVAYIPEKKVMVLIILTARDEASYLQSVPAFEELVHSYLFLTEDVKY